MNAMTSKKSILLTGGAGYIGSHVAVELISSGYDLIIADNLCNSRADVIDRIALISGVRPQFYQIDVRDTSALEQVFMRHEIAAAVHLAGYKAVAESVELPLKYYRNNIDTTLSLLEVMSAHSCRRIIFSSSATVYGQSNPSPCTEDMPTGGCTNPYGRTKHMIEQILSDTAQADKQMSVMLLRYFNPVGAHESGLIGEEQQGVPNNLMPYITQVAAGIRPHLNVFGNDYPTPDGSGIRDFIHIVDLARGHAAAVDYVLQHDGLQAVNLGTGRGYSVLELVGCFEQTNGVRVPYKIAPRRSGDVAVCFAATDKAARLLGWRAQKDLADMCRDAWRWQQKLRKIREEDA